MIFGLALIIVGLVALGVKAGIIEGDVWSYVWPLLVILIGVRIVFFRKKRGMWCCGPFSWRDREESDKGTK
ncbi:MAG: DUF5668 domain-containing protein [Dehalococcoidia bacterium]|nr:DUF5668 domain-containing protein [Dehalococcoidia bacterium]MDZ4246620.1 DUF5668 domain-containing protein [Dehalococcoidia bacterium]